MERDHEFRMTPAPTKTTLKTPAAKSGMTR
jgi:hypothetical protein